MPLVQGVDYTLTPIPNTGPPVGGDNAHWQGFNVTFTPARRIATNNKLRIQKDIFEMFGDANIWTQGESAQLAEFPIPEPSVATLMCVTSMGWLMRRRRA